MPPAKRRPVNRRRQPAGLSRDQMRTLLRGSAAASVQSKATPRQWHKLVNTARRRGVTLDSLVSGIPTPLAQRTNAGIMQQARRTVRSAYQPVFADISTQERQARALDAKRAADNQHYRDWLNARNSALITANQAFAQGVADRQQALANSVQQSYATAAQGAAANNANRTDSVTLGNQEQAAAQSATTPQSTFAGNLMAAEQSRTLGQQRLADNMLSSTAANAMLAHAATDARRASETHRTLEGLAGERRRFLAQRSADVQREVTRLRDQEITKANAQQQLDLAAQELGARTAISRLQASLDKAKLRETIRSNKANEGIRADSNNIRRDALALNISIQQYREMEGNRRYQLDLRRFGAEQAKDRYLRRHRLGVYDPSGKGGKKPRLTPDQQNRITRSIDQATNVARYMREQGYGETQIANELKTGGRIRTDDGRVVAWPAFDDGIASAGWEVSQGLGLTDQTINRLHNLGYIIGGRYRLARRRR